MANQLKMAMVDAIWTLSDGLHKSWVSTVKQSHNISIPNPQIQNQPRTRPPASADLHGRPVLQYHRVNTLRAAWAHSICILLSQICVIRALGRRRTEPF